MNDDFEEKWNAGIEKANERIKSDESLNQMQKRHQDLLKRLRTIEQDIGKRVDQIVREEIKKAMRGREVGIPPGS